MKATFTNEMARERLAYLRRRHDEESRRRKLYPKPKALTICSKNGAVVRLHKALDSRKIAVLEPGTTCMADEEAFDGDILRCRLVEPVRGWLSRKVVTCPDADFGTLLAPKEAVQRVPAGHGVAGRAASNRDLVAAEPKTQIAVCEDDVVALPVACGEMAFRGDALEPIIKQRGPWDEQKRSGYKHWRTDAALRGFYTRTEDEAKVKQWDASLKLSLIHI